MRAIDTNEANLHTIRSNTEKMKQTAYSETTSSATMSRRTRPKDTEEMEKKLLSIWIECQTNNTSETAPLTTTQKALIVSDTLKSTKFV